MYIQEAGYVGLGSFLGAADVYLFLTERLGGSRRVVTSTREDPPKDIVDLYPYDRVNTQIFKMMDGPVKVATDAKGKWTRFDVDLGWQFWLRVAEGHVELKPSALTRATFSDLLHHLQTPGTAPVSVELDDAPPASSAEGRVFFWMMKNINKILAAEQQFAIDRRAIAGAIAWEAIANPYPGVKGDLATATGMARFSGPGKVHYKEFRPDQQPMPAAQEGNTVAREVEQLGKLPPRTMQDRWQILKTTDGSLLYIGTIMRAFADAAALGGYYLDCDPAMLTTFYNGSWSIAGATTYFQTQKRAPAALTPGPTMGTWIQQNLGLVERMVARPPAAFCKKPRGY